MASIEAEICFMWLAYPEGMTESSPRGEMERLPQLERLLDFFGGSGQTAQDALVEVEQLPERPGHRLEDRLRVGRRWQTGHGDRGEARGAPRWDERAGIAVEEPLQVLQLPVGPG